jgi:hypothetical protein
MNQLTDKEKAELKFHLIGVMDKFLEDETKEDNNIGWIPNNLEKYMADAAFAVLESINQLNYFLDKEEIIK